MILKLVDLENDTTIAMRETLTKELMVHSILLNLTLSLKREMY